MTNNLLIICNSIRKQKVTEGINTILSLFTLAKQQRLFPRTIMTKATRGQIIINSVEEMINRFEEADYQDCRINAYPAFINKAEEKDYENGVNMNLFAPNILFIDLDERDFSSKEELDKITKKILKHISVTLHGFNPLLMWTGRGYHIIIPVQQTEALEQFEDFEILTDKASEQFLKFAEDYLSLNKADKANNPAFKSCLIRVPYTLNSKCFGEGKDKDPEVKVSRGIDISRPLPSINNLLVEFLTFLSDRKLKENLELDRRIRLKKKFMHGKTGRPNSISYVEKLLTLPLRDYRKNAINLILAPYFVNVLRLSDDDSFQRIKQWILKCNKIEPLKPSIDDFNAIIKYAIKRARQTSIKPLRFEETLQYKNKKLFRLLSS